MDEFISVRNLKKTYTVYEGKFFKRQKKEIHALKNIDFEIKKGEFLGYVGPNGAGKSTTIKILTGIMHPDSGMVTVNGFCPWQSRKEYVKNIGVVFGQKTQLWWDLPVVDTFELLISIYGVDKKTGRKRIAELTERLDLKEFINRPVRQLSLGQRMRSELGASLIHDPDILFLDEPTIGLDIVSRHGIMEFLKEINANGKTILLTTHNLKEIEELCNEILIIADGELVFKGCTEKLNNLTEIPRILKITLKPFDGTLSEDQRIIISDFRGELEMQKMQLNFRIDKSVSLAYISKIMFEHFEIEDFTIDEPEIESIVKGIFQTC